MPSKKDLKIFNKPEMGIVAPDNHTNRRVNVEMSQLHNIGNFESIRITAGLSVDITDDAYLEDEYDNIAGKVIKQLMVLKEEIIP